MRQRTKTSRALCCHAVPSRGFVLSREQALKKKFQSGDITTEELREYAAIKAEDSKAPTSVVICIWGRPQVISFGEYKRYYEPLGFTYKRM